MSESLTRDGRESIRGIPGTCATPNFTYLARGPCFDTVEHSGADSGRTTSESNGFVTATTAAQHVHYDDVIMTMLASQITSLTVVYSIVYSGVNQRKHQSSASLAFVREIHRGPVNFPHKWPVTRKMLPFDDVIMHLGNRKWPLHQTWCHRH